MDGSGRRAGSRGIELSLFSAYAKDMKSMSKRTYIKTESIQSNRVQYKRTHMKIVRGIMKLMRRFRVKVTTKQLSEETGLPPMTIRNHGRDLNIILNDEEAALLGQFLSVVENISLADAGRASARTMNKRIFDSLLVFIAKNKQEFVPICEDRNNWELLRNMIRAIYDKLALAWFPVSEPTPSADSEAGEMFTVMAVQLIRRWSCETGCEIERMGTCEQRLQILADQMYSRCRF